MFELTALEKIYKYLYENGLNPNDMSPEDLKSALQPFDKKAFSADPVQSLAKGETVYSENLLIRQNTNIAVLRHLRYRPHKSHKHDYIQFTYVYRQGCVFIGPGGEEIRLKQGDLLLLAPNTEHQIHVDADEGIVFHLNVRRSTFDQAFMRLLDGEDILAQFFGRIINGASLISYVLFEVGEDEKVRQLHLDMFREMQLSHKMSDRMINIYFEWLCVYLIQNYECVVWSEDTGSHFVDIMKILNYLRVHYQDASLEETSRAFNYSTTYFCKIIKKYTGQTYGMLINAVRMQKACEMLGKSRLSIAEIASHIGYRDVSSFYRSFKTAIGVTPAQYQLAHRSEETD